MTIQSMANNPSLTYYHASALTPPAIHSDFFNTHAWLQQLASLGFHHAIAWDGDPRHGKRSNRHTWVLCVGECTFR